MSLSLNFSHINSDMPCYAIILTEQDNMPCSLLDEVAGVPLLHRALITCQRAGISHIYLTGTPNLNITSSIKSNPKITANWTWLESTANLELLANINFPPQAENSPQAEQPPTNQLSANPPQAENSPQAEQPPTNPPLHTENSISQKPSTPNNKILIMSAWTLVHAKDLKNFVLLPDDSYCAYHAGQNFQLAIADYRRLPENMKFGETWFTSLPHQEFIGFICSLTKGKKYAEQAMLHSYTSSMDGIVDVYFNRPIGRLITLPLVRWHGSPNAVTIVSMIVGLIASGLFLNYAYIPTLIAAILLQGSAMIDCMDGDIARLQFRESTLGQWLDIVGDNVVHVALFACLMIREYQNMQCNTPLILGAMLVLGTIIAFILVIYAQTQLPKFNAKNQISNAENQISSALDRLHSFIAKMTNRDFTVLLIISALIGNLYWFLWLAAIGTQCFWLILLIYIFSIRLRFQR